MSAAILIIEYALGDAQRGLPPEAWRGRAEQIAAMDGLRWKYWLRVPGGDDRGGVYLFASLEAAERAGEILAGSLRESGARDVAHRAFEVDPELSPITRGAV